MKTFVKAYLKYNLGDDLFINILCDRYKANKFICYSKQYSYNNIKKYNNNLIVKNGTFNRILDKVINIVTNKKYNFSIINIKKSDNTIFIGGSMFIQTNSNIKKSELEESKKYYIIGSNFGPYKTDEYHQYYKKIFIKAQDVCFREKYSYDLFNELDNVRYASDIVFTLNTSKIKITENKKVIISVIECETKSKGNYKEKYENKIIEMAEYFINNGYKVILMSYCKFEKDEEAIETIIEKCNDNIKSKIHKYYYRGNIVEALNVMGDCQIVIGTRFHANILGLLLGKTIIPIAYSDKTINVLNDMNFKGKIINLKDIDKFDVNDLTQQDLNYKHDVSFQIKDAENQFIKLDKIFSNEGKYGRVKNKKYN